MLPTLIIQQKIHIIRGEQVMLDYDLAELYGIETRILNQAVKRNIKRFPPDFMFQLNKEEWKNLKSQIVISSWGGTRKLPFAFTEQGLTMLSGVLNSDTAIEVNIAIMRTFVAVRRLVSTTALPASPAERIKKLEHNVQELKECLHRPERHQRRHTRATGTYQPSAGRIAECQTPKRRTTQSHRIQDILTINQL